MEIDRDHLELRIDETWVPADEFSKVFKDFLGLVSEVADTVTKTQDAFEWHVAVEKGSNLMRLQPRPKNSSIELIPLVLNTIDIGLDELISKGTKPKFFNNAALKHVQNLDRYSCQGQSPTGKITALGPLEEKRSFKGLEAKIKEMLVKLPESWGSITGRLKKVDEKKEGDYITIEDELTEKRIECKLPVDLDNSIIHKWKQRIRIEGWIKYSQDGHPIRIRIEKQEDIRVLKEQAELPSFRDVLGIHKRVGR